MFDTNINTFIAVSLTMYAFFAIFLIFNKRINADKVVQSKTFNESSLTIDNSAKAYYEKAAEGKMFVQQLSYIFSLILTWLAALGIIGLFIFPIGFLIWFIILILTPLTIVVNAFWVYPKQIVEAEQWALFTGTASKHMKNQRSLAWFVWIFYGIVAFISSVILFSEII